MNSYPFENFFEDCKRFIAEIGDDIAAGVEPAEAIAKAEFALAVSYRFICQFHHVQRPRYSIDWEHVNFHAFAAMHEALKAAGIDADHFQAMDTFQKVLDRSLVPRLIH